MQRDRGLVLIVGYKLVKGTAWLVLAAVLLVMLRMGLASRLAVFAGDLRRHAGPAWSLELAELIARGASRRGIGILALALFADGISSFVEAWALHHGHWWGPWLVVVLTASLMPFEVVALFHHPTIARGTLLVLNLVIVVYLVNRSLAEHRNRPRN